MAKAPDNTKATRRRLLDLIASRAVAVAFQPILDLNDGMIVAYEALTRIVPESGFDNPGALFAAAAEHGLLWELEAVTRAAAIEAAASWPSDTRLFLNTTPSVFADPRFPDSLRSAVQGARGLSPDRVVLEITELSDEQDFPGLAEQVRRLRGLGFDAAIDDAGAGASGLNRIMIIRPAWIKLDRAFVRGIDSDHYKQNLVRFFAHFARLSGVSIIAEGIERREELATVIGLGLRYAQGYYLGKPGAREQTTDPRFVSAVRGRWAEVDAEAAPANESATLVRLCRPVLTVDPGTTVADAAAVLLADQTLCGAVVRDGRRVGGWASRQSILDRAADKGGERVADALSESVCHLPPGASIAEALELACIMDEEAVCDPLIVASGAAVIGVVRIRDLIRAATREGRLGQSWRAPVTGLPARIRADQHVAELIRAARAHDRRPADLHADAAFIDIRAFASYNAAFGYELGDRLIRSLSDLIHAVVAGPTGAFVAHLGEDRFLLTCAAGRLERQLAALADTFDRQAALLPGGVNSAGLPCPRMSLRVLFLPGVFARISQPRDLYRREQQLRAASETRSHRPFAYGAPGSSIITDWRRDELRRAG